MTYHTSSQHSSVVELLICNQWVAGSNPAAGSIFFCLNFGGVRGDLQKNFARILPEQVGIFGKKIPGRFRGDVIG